MVNEKGNEPNAEICEKQHLSFRPDAVVLN
jgi:hypothetical protein